MPNHYHFLLIQLEDEGIREVFSKVQNAYVRYFNLRNDRVGPLFQSRFKALRIESDEILRHVSRYIHLNPSTSFLVKAENLSGYYWSSYPDYLGIRKSNIVEVDVDFILKLFNGKRSFYEKFVLDQVDYQRSLAYLKQTLPE
jgi:putative transposase